MLRYALAIFVSAFLLFQVQPLTGRFILPWFGGGPSIWTACMLFFQLVLLAGYLYSHLLTTFFQPRAQAVVHLTLLVGSLACLPIIPSADWKPAPEDAPLRQILLLLTATVGAPYFLLSTTGPLMQRWFTRAVPGGSPWRLYALSNVGSLLALISYPFVFEPLLKLRDQAFSWSALYSLYAGLAALCAFSMFRSEQPLAGSEPVSLPARNDAADAAIPRPRLTSMLLWLLLSASASVMLLATTNQLCIDVATVPFLWILPLALYLISFILCFDSPRWYDRRLYSLLLLLFSPFACKLLSDGPDADITLQLVLFPAVLFVCCMMCHGELYQLRPQPRWLTLYFVIVSAGGALGGVFVAIVAPRVFHGYFEYHTGLFSCCVAGALAMVAQKVWLRPLSAAWAIRLITSTVQLLALSVWFFTPVWEHLTDTADVLLKSGCGILLIAGLQLTGLFETRPRLLLNCWVLLAILQLLLLLSVLQQQAPGLVTTELRLQTLAAVLLPEALAVTVAVMLRWWTMQRSITQFAPAAAVAVAAGLLLWALSAIEILSVERLYSIVITAVAGLLMDVAARGFRGPGKAPLGLALTIPVITLLMILGLRLSEVAGEETTDKEIVAVSRNFYGVLRVRHEPADGDLDVFQNPFPDYFSLKHGQISHGCQYQDDYWSKLPTTYYGEESGFAIAVRVAREMAARGDGHPLRVGTIGLGTGTIAAFGQREEFFCFYDINPDVLALSSKGIFTYLKDSQASIDVKLGDARIVMEQDLAEGRSQQFDVLAVDAFSSDAIPVHLLTAECAEIYAKHLRPGGILAVHISNRFLNLEPVARGMAEQLGWQAFLIDNPDDDSHGVFASSWVLITKNADVAEDPEVALAVDSWSKKDWVLKWTDDYSGIWSVLQF
jgi:hypothetical protein